MRIGSPKEVMPGEARVAMTPDSAIQLQKLGYECFIESGAGLEARFSDADYQAAGVTVVDSAEALFQSVDVIAKVRPPLEDEVSRLSKGQTLVGFFNPAGNETLLELAKSRQANVIAMEMVPRISRAQKMDALSSMANIAGYRAVIEAGNHFGRFFTGQVTAAGKVPPAKVLVIGAGVAGLAAIGTAQSLGAIVRAFDVRPEVAEQIESMGAEFLFLDFEDAQDGAATGGYAAPSSPEFREKQLALFLEQAPEIDIVITTALIPNREAPELWTQDMVEAMKPGSVIVDLAAEKGGNCKLTVADQKVVTDNGVTIIGYTDFPSRMAAQASTLYATNVRHMMTDLTPEKDGQLVHNMEDDVIRSSTVTFEGEITFPPPPLKVQAIASKATPKQPEKTPEEKAAEEAQAMAKAGRQQTQLLVIGAALMALIGLYAPTEFMQHFIVFVLAVFVGFQVIWGVAHSLHTPLMAITNAISGIIIVGAILQVDSSIPIVAILAGISVLIATINIVGGFMVTRRMLQMFKKS
ncbi:MAG: Re/Si-specific NAD(P)(+) transhydrogenase subunit alpha [Litoricola sp.]|jgi:NAD(P) transhydrogenase subunit alpha|nr:Re/Si-specific NAD(P)(+) transhydrogenase subunit alpha [Litorivicinus sp.]MDA0895126.1 Re/Si-specific NAD(P)(+) transhydrogenase subunit alpha [Pseudomonadota bacterium]MDA8548800.1 Re/Si-specific NAD(P)(+) transhydrogenase subunit alpha [Litorivicinaceae bacterium]HAB77459.1 Re/Si-specific NAD(P)(+) transhydrogenase subunit alpha [Gammaproteobacteria bacterium]MBL6810553.1 Re/Si-specific NAD(P)(+) transhydrogenase subunit alpha [Litorivicinus sp.]